MAVGREARALQHLGDLAADDGHPAHGLGVGGGGEQAEEAALADDVAVRVELLHADVVEVAGPVHGRAAVGLGEDEELALAGLGPGVGGQPVEGRADGVRLVDAVVRVGAQDAEAGAGDGGQRVGVLQLVLAVAEEGEVVGGEPAQQFPGLVDLFVGEVVERLAGQVVGDAQRGVAHLVPVLDGLPYVGQHAQQVGGDLLEVGAVGLAVDLDVDPGLDERVVRQLVLLVLGALAALRAGRDAVALGEDLDELAGDITAYDDLRVDHDVDAASLPGQLVGDGVDQERHVVGDDLDHRVAARPAVLLDGRGVHPDVRRALRTRLGQPVVGGGGAEDVHGVAARDVLRSGVQVVALEVGEEHVLSGALLLGPGGRNTHPGGTARATDTTARAVVSYLRRPCEQLGLGFVQLGLHVLWLLSRAVA